MIKFHGQKSVWPRIKVQINKTRKSEQIFAAIAYVGVDATKLMPLRRGDVLVCNASDAAIKQGATSAKALQAFFSKGVKVFNEPRLHGKVVVFQKRAFVWSANASTRSRDVLHEAVVETTDSRVIGASLNFVQLLAQEISLLDLEDIKRLQRIPVKKRELDKSPRIFEPLLEVPNQVSLLKLVPIKDTPYSETLEKKISKEKKSVSSEFFKGGSRADIQTIKWGSKFWDEVKPNMWIIEVNKTGRMSAPKQVIKLSKVTKTYGIVWLAKPKRSKPSVKDVDLLHKIGFNWEANKPLVLRGAKTSLILKLFEVS